MRGACSSRIFEIVPRKSEMHKSKNEKSTLASQALKQINPSLTFDDAQSNKFKIIPTHFP